jgi:hypothetical protein
MACPKLLPAPPELMQPEVGKLSAEDAEFLIGEAERADQLVAKVAVLQRVAEEDRR